MIRNDTPGRRGLAWWVAVPAATVLTVVAGMLDYRLNHSLGMLFDVVYVLSCVAAICLVRGESLFAPMVAPPPMMAVTVAISVVVGMSNAKSTSAALLSVGVPLVNSFPTMALATALVLILGGIRILRRRRAPQPVRPSYR